MNQLLEWLEGGDLTSDGTSDQVASFVLENLFLINDLVEGLEVQDDVVRGRATDALEKVVRSHPQPVSEHLPLLIQSAIEDPVPMVRWHIAMILGHVSMNQKWGDPITDTLISMLQDKSVFVVSWAIVSLCIVARQYPDRAEEIITAIAPLGDSNSAAIRSKVRNAIPILTNPQAAFPKGWIKSEHLQYL
jgi:hypothetical protein